MSTGLDPDIWLGGGHAVAEDNPALKLIYSDWPGWVTWEIAKQKDFFAQEGVAVELLWMDYVAGMDAFAAGQADAVCMTNGDALVIGAASGKPSTAIILNDYSNGNDMVVGRPGLESISDLKGLRVGVEVGFVGHLLLLTALEAHGMTENDVTLVNIPTNELPQALAAGSVDAITAWQPNSGQALKIVPGSKRLYSSADSPGIIYDMLYVSHESLAERGDDWAKVVRSGIASWRSCRTRQPRGDARNPQRPHRVAAQRVRPVSGRHAHPVARRGPVHLAGRRIGGAEISQRLERLRRHVQHQVRRLPAGGNRG